MNVFSKKKISLSIGARGEKAANTFLQKNGYKILATNFCNKSGRRLGEIDIIAKEKEEIVFVEVKTRVYSNNNILPEENISRSKLYKLSKVAAFYLRTNNIQDVSYRFDAITLIVNPDGNSARLKHIKNIFI